jgi:hypothetical protein
MRTLALGIGAASVLAVFACNALNGADALSTDPSASDEPALTGPGTSGSSGTSGTSGTTGHDHPTTPEGGSSSGSSGGAPDAGDASIDATGPTFTDDFQRANGAVGNGWFEKTPGRLELVNGAVRQNAKGLYKNLFVARPTSENLRDVLVQVTVSFPTASADPGVFARIQSGSEVQDRFFAYSLYADGANDLFISRDDGTSFTDMGSSVISPPLVPGQLYRLSLQATGDNPVRLVGSVAKTDGTVLATITANDASSSRIAAAGAVGFGSSVSQNGTWDDFRRVTLLP